MFTFLHTRKQQGKLAGRRVLLTGASGNIGQAIARRLMNEGATIALHYHSNVEPINQLCKLAARQQVFPLQGSLQTGQQARQVFTQAQKKLGGVDVLINCIGTSRDNSVLLLNDEDAEITLQSNLAPVVYLSEYMLEQGTDIEHGRIINITSITGLVGQPMRSLYGAAKGAVIAFTKSIARDVAELGWTANCIAPQVVEGGLADQMKSQIQTMLANVTPIKRPCTPDDITGMTSYLCTQESGYITGTVLNISGGLITW